MKNKWLLFSIYRPPKQNISCFHDPLSDALDFYASNYDNIIINGDFNLDPCSPELTEFIGTHSLYNHMQEKLAENHHQAHALI